MTQLEQRPYMRNGVYLDDCHKPGVFRWDWRVLVTWAGMLLFSALMWAVAITLAVEMLKRWGWWPS